MFSKFSKIASRLAGNSIIFTFAFLLVLIWLVSGPIYGFSDSWELVINTVTTVITFLMVFIIQNSQNRETLAIQLKLDELIRAVEEAHNEMVDIEDLTDEQVKAIYQKYQALSAKVKEEGLERGIPSVELKE